MKTALIAATAAFLIGGGAVASAQQTVIITREQQPVIQKYVVEQQVAPAQLPSDYDLQIGTALPDTIEVHRLGVPEMPKQYEYVVINGQTVLVDPDTRQVVQILPAQ